MNCINCGVVRTILVFLAGLITVNIANAQSGPTSQGKSVLTPSATNVNVVNTPSVNVDTLPAVTLSGTPTFQVGNTKSNPVNALDVERAARIPYESIQTMQGFPQETATFPSAPSGYRLVLQHVSSTFLMNSGATQLPSMTIYPNNGSYVARASFMGQVGGIGSQTFGAVNVDVLSYWDPGDGQPLIVANGDFYPSVVNFVTLSGYLENCAVTACPPVQR
jgi:hypothetical protein